MSAVFRPMTFDEQRAATALGTVTYPVASYPKRLARSLFAQATGSQTITDAQAGAMWRQVVRFRRQITDASVLEVAYTIVGKPPQRAKKP